MSGEADGYRALAVASYAGSLHGRRLLGGLAVLNELHRPPDPTADLRCPTCRDSRGRRLAWPCRTFVEMLRGLGFDPGPAERLAALTGAHMGEPLDVQALMHAQREAVIGPPNDQLGPDQLDDRSTGGMP